MKKALYFVAVLTIVALASCRKEEKIIETNDRGVPMSIANIIMGDTYDIDTLYKSEGRTVIYIDNPDYTQHIIYSGEDILVNLPTLRVDSLGANLYDVQDMLRSAKVNFADQQSIDKMQLVFPQYPDFRPVVVDDTTRTGQHALYAFIVSRPDDKVKGAGDMLRWIERCINDTLAFNSNVKTFGQEIERAFFGEWTQEESEFDYVSSRSMLVYEQTPTYVTYNDYFYGYMGGAHGITCNRFVTYLTQEDKALTADCLFKPDSEDAIRELIYEAIAADEDFMATHRITSLSQARTYIQRYLDGEQLPIPDPAFLTEGVVFCYQPYEIGPYSDGIFQLVIPYSKIAQYFAFNPFKR